MRAIIPLSATGSYRFVNPALANTAGSELTVRADTNFGGFQKVFYLVEKKGRGVRLRMDSVIDVKNGIETQRNSPALKLLEIRGNLRRVRLLFLERVSDNEHNMAVLAGLDLQQVESLTQEVQHDGKSCVQGPKRSCSWVPAGVAVLAEQQTLENGVLQWRPVI